MFPVYGMLTLGVDGDTYGHAKDADSYYIRKVSVFGSFNLKFLIILSNPSK